MCTDIIAGNTIKIVLQENVCERLYLNSIIMLYTVVYPYDVSKVYVGISPFSHNIFLEFYCL